MTNSKKKAVATPQPKAAARGNAAAAQPDKRFFDFVEVGTSDFDTLIQLADDATIAAYGKLMI